VALASHRSVRDRRAARHPAGGAGRRRPGAGSAGGRPSERATGGTGWTALVPMLRSQEAPTLHKHPEVAVAAGLAPILVVSRCRCHRTRARPVGHHTKRSSKRKKGVFSPLEPAVRTHVQRRPSPELIRWRKLQRPLRPPLKRAPLRASISSMSRPRRQGRLRGHAGQSRKNP